MNCGLDNFISNFKNLYERGLAFAKAFVFDANLAEDITSESLIVLWNKLREVSILNSLKYICLQ